MKCSFAVLLHRTTLPMMAGLALSASLQAATASLQAASTEVNNRTVGEKNASAPVKGAILSAGEIQELIDRLRSPDYRERTEATRKLMSAGRSAVAPVAAAAQTDDPELALRCLRILTFLYHKGDAETISRAEAALRKLQEKGSPLVARQAEEVLQKPDRPSAGESVVINGNGVQIRIVAGARIARNILPQAAKPRGFQREVNVVDKGRKIHIRETIAPGKRQIEVEITQKINGKEKTTRYQARTSAELKRRSKEAYELYRQYIGKAKLKILAARGAGVPAAPQAARLIQAVVGQAANKGGVKMQVRMINGRREIKVTEGQRRISLTDTNGRNITVQVTETDAQGKPQTRTYRAQTAEELKRKHPAAARLYEKYAAGQTLRLR